MWAWLGLRMYPSCVLFKTSHQWETCCFDDPSFGDHMHQLIMDKRLGLVPLADVSKLPIYLITGARRRSQRALFLFFSFTVTLLMISL